MTSIWKAASRVTFKYYSGGAVSDTIRKKIVNPDLYNETIPQEWITTFLCRVLLRKLYNRILRRFNDL